MSHYPKKHLRRRIQKEFLEPTLTEQHHRETVSIHSILKRYQATGVIDHVAKHQGTYFDYSEVPDFQTAQQMVADAHSMFETVPSEIRAEFGNDPAKFIDFMQNPENRNEIEAYGLDASHLGETEEIPHNNPQTPKEGVLGGEGGEPPSQTEGEAPK